MFRMIVIASMLALAPVVTFASNGDYEDEGGCQGNCPQNGGGVGDISNDSTALAGALAVGVNKNLNSNTAVGIGEGGDASTRTKVDVAVEGDSTYVEGDDYDFPASAAPTSFGQSAGTETPCGDVTAIGTQVMGGGGSIATVSETCRAYRLQLLENHTEGTSWGFKLARFTHFAGWFPRMLLHIGSFGILN